MGERESGRKNMQQSPTAENLMEDFTAKLLQSSG